MINSHTHKSQLAFTLIELLTVVVMDLFGDTLTNTWIRNTNDEGMSLNDLNT